MLMGHPLREGVDWNMFIYNISSKDAVTLYVRVWIETGEDNTYYGLERHPLREGVDWNGYVPLVDNNKLSHPLREGVDWNKQSCANDWI